MIGGTVLRQNNSGSSLKKVPYSYGLLNQTLDTVFLVRAQNDFVYEFVVHKQRSGPATPSGCSCGKSWENWSFACKIPVSLSHSPLVFCSQIPNIVKKCLQYPSTLVSNCSKVSMKLNQNSEVRVSVRQTQAPAAAEVFSLVWLWTSGP